MADKASNENRVARDPQKSNSSAAVWRTNSIEQVVRATRDGELVFFVNDAVIAFYANNRGSLRSA
jgi:hypothetical protein